MKNKYSEVGKNLLIENKEEQYERVISLISTFYVIQDPISIKQS